MLTAWRVPLALAAVVAAILSGCGGASGQADQADTPTEATNSLPIAAAPSPDPQAASAVSEPRPDWTEPDDPVEAYRVLNDKFNHLRANPSLDLLGEIYARNTAMMRSERRQVKRMIRTGARVVEGSTVLDDVLLVGQDEDTALIEVSARQQPSTTVDSEGTRRDYPELCQSYEVELRDTRDGWRIAALTIGEDQSSWRCEQ